jgi:hypothetical protein
MANADFATGVRLVIQTALQSPGFLYRIDEGRPPQPGETVVPLTDHEIASRLSFLLWNSIPDVTLANAANAGQLNSPAQIEAQARRMLADPKAKEALANFTTQWLNLSEVDHISKSAADFPTYSDSLRALFKEETARVVASVMWDGDGSLKGLLSAPFTYVNGPLATFYKMPGVTGSAFQRVTVDPAQHGGILMHAGVLASSAHPDQTSPVLRGKLVRQRFFCQSLPPPPVNVSIELPAFDPNRTTRERYSAHSSDPSCSGCHRLMDPIGLGLENFDAVGLWRTTENNKPIDASGEIVSTRDADGAFVGPSELSARIGASADANDCVVKQLFRYAYSRTETLADRCTLVDLSAQFAASQFNVRELLVALTQTTAFRSRNVSAP